MKLLLSPSSNVVNTQPLPPSPLERVAQLVQALTQRSARQILGEVLDVLLDVLPARAGAAIVDGQVVTEAGFALETQAAPCRDPSFELTTLVEDQAEVTYVPDVRRGPFRQPETGAELYRTGNVGALALPLLAGSRFIGSICLWLDERFEPTAEASALVETIASAVSLAFERDHRPETAEGGLLALGEMNRLASLGLLLDSSLHALRTPSSSLVIQLDELRRQASELALLLDPNDSLAVDALRDLQQTLDDMTVAATVVRKELTRLLDVTEPTSEKGEIELNRLVHEAVAIARPELEQRGFTVEESFGPDGRVAGNRQELLHLMLSSLFSLGRGEHVLGRLPVIEVNVGGGEGTRRISLRCRTQSGDVATRPPQLDESTEALAQKVGAFLELKPGSVELTLHTTKSEEPAAPKVEQKVRRILIVDDDPMFARALRRALTPHEVRVSGTAGEAELLLLEGSFVPDLVVCDLWLPGSSGRTLHQRIQASLPAIAQRFVFVSGAPLTERDRAYFQEAGCRTMTKPVQVEDLLEQARFT